MKKYHIDVFYSEEDEGYIANISDLEFCSAFGNTSEEALKEVLKAKDAWIRSSKKAHVYKPVRKFKRFAFHGKIAKKK